MEVKVAGIYNKLVFAITDIETTQLVWHVEMNRYAVNISFKDVETANKVDDGKVIAVLDKMVQEVARRSA